jgi:hypothetical protein
MQGEINLKQPDMKLWIIIIDTRTNQGLPPEVLLSAHVAVHGTSCVFTVSMQWRLCHDVPTPSHCPSLAIVFSVAYFVRMAHSPHPCVSVSL